MSPETRKIYDEIVRLIGSKSETLRNDQYIALHEELAEQCGALAAAAVENEIED